MPHSSDPPYAITGLAIGVLGGLLLPFLHWIFPTICYTATVILIAIEVIRWRKENRNDKAS